MRKIAILGLGQVGSSLANQLLNKGLADQLVLLDANDDRAVGLQNDLLAGWPTADLVIQDWSALATADVLLVAIGNQDQLRESRFGELTSNAQAIHQIAPKIQNNKFSGVVINLANPNEEVTALIQQEWQLPPKRVIGTGTVLDTARLRLAIARAGKQNYDSIEGYVYGQHDGALVSGWSTIRVNGQKIEQPVNGKKLDDHELDVQAKLNGFYALKGLGSDWNGLVAWTLRITKSILTNSHKTFSVAVMQPQYEGYVSFPVSITRQGIGNFLLLPLYPLENEQIKVAANAIREQLATMQSLIN